MNRLLTTIPGARGRGPVRVERKIRRRSAEEVRGAGVTAVGDALFRMVGRLPGRDVLRILMTKLARRERQPKPALVTTWADEISTERAPVSAPPADRSTAPLIIVLCAGLDHINGRFPKAIWL